MNAVSQSKQEKLKRRGRNQGRRLAKRLRILKKSRYMKRWLLRNPWIRPICVFNYAAIKIQSLARRFIIRTKWRNWRRDHKQKQPHGVALLPSSPFHRPVVPSSSHHHAGHKLSKKSPKVSSKKISSKQLDRYLNYIDRSRNLQKQLPNYRPPAWINGGFSSWSVVRIQSWWRMIRSNRRLLLRRRLITQVAAIVIQTSWRNYHYFTQLPMIPEIIAVNNTTSSPKPSSSPSSPKRHRANDPSSAVRRIQLCWRKYCNKRIYLYFRNLILYKLQGAPADLLRTIIPNEADLLDRASGVHIKFRLGGRIFPPKVYFKIFTHRPLCDIGAFAPRDYAQEKPLNDYYQHNKSSIIEKFNSQNKNNAAQKRGNIRIGVKYFDTIIHTTNALGLANWYQRDDQNNWRAISSLLIEKHVEAPPWFQESGLGRENTVKHHHYYHFSKNARKADLQTYRRRRKREWMMKLYSGIQQQQEENELVEEAKRVAEEKQRFSPSLERDDRFFSEKLGDDDAKKYNSNEFFRTLDYKSQVFFRDNVNNHEGENIQKMYNLETNETIPFIAPDKGKYNVNPSVDSKAGADAKGRSAKQYPDFELTKTKNSTQPLNNDNLLEWSLALDYDDYVKDWNMIGTSLPSDMLPKTIY